MSEVTKNKTRFDALASRTFRRILRQLSLDTKKVFDIGCGSGEHLVHFGKGSVGLTTRADEVEHGKKNGISITKGNAELVSASDLGYTAFDAIWANNLFEHLLSPHAFIVSLKEISTPETQLILGVPVIPKLASLMRIKKFRGALASAHVNFFTMESLRLSVERAGWKVSMIRPFVVNNRFIDEYILGPFMPHLYVVAYNDSAFRYSPSKLREWEGDNHYAKVIQTVQI